MRDWKDAVEEHRETLETVAAAGRSTGRRLPAIARGARPGGTMSVLTDNDRETLERLAGREDLRSSEWAQRILDAVDRNE